METHVTASNLEKRSTEVFSKGVKDVSKELKSLQDSPTSVTDFYTKENEVKDSRRKGWSSPYNEWY